MNKIIFITGSCGVGKTSIVPLLKETLSDYDIYDFDELGVPENPPLSWRHETTKHWLKVARENLENNKSTIISGLSIPSEIEEFAKDLLDKIYMILLDISIDEREKRLKLRTADEELICDLEEVEGLRKWVPESNLKGKEILDVTHLSIEETAEKIVKIVENY